MSPTMTPPSVAQPQSTTPEPPLTIARAKEIYRARGSQSVSADFRDLLCSAIDSKAKLAFDNHSYFDALFLTDIMFSRSQQQIRLLTGPKGDGFLSTLQKPFEAALERIRNSRGSVKIILLSTEVSPLLLDLQKRFPNVLEVFLAQASQKLNHFIVCDSTMARLEEPHGDLTPDTLATEIKAKVFFNSPEQATMLEGLFDAMWQRLKSFSASPAVA